MTRHDYALLPEGAPRFQLVDGEFHMAPAPNRRHQRIVRDLVEEVLSYLKHHPLGELYFAPFDVYLGDIHVFQPDIVFFAKARLGHLTDAGAEGAPDLVVEVLSKKTANLDKGVKKEVYSRFGVTELWLVDPDNEEVQIYRLRENAETPAAVLRKDDTLTTPVFEGLAISLARVFRE
jgi:Uma2 family endonuclease